MAVGNNPLTDLHAVPGVRLGTTCAGFKHKNRDDLLVIELADGNQTAAVFTRNAFCAAPVEVARAHLAGHATSFLLINSGNANCGLGQQGLDVAKQSCVELARLAGGASEAVLPFSTGVIAEPMSLDLFKEALPKAFAGLQADNWSAAARAIMTTDTYPKGASRQFVLDGETITMTGIAKGSGMIHPDMATMLAFICTDASIAQADLQACLKRAVDVSFNRITVDGDTSTNDACVLAASCQKGSLLDGEQLEAFYTELEILCQELAQAVIRDGEGATRLMTVKVEQAASDAEADEVAFTVAHSPLVKTALFAGDPNWGRILAAVGRAKVENFSIAGINIFLNDVQIVRNGARDAGYTEEQGQAIMQQDEVIVRIELARGEHSSTVWTCDLSYDYVRINAEYRS